MKVPWPGESFKLQWGSTMRTDSEVPMTDYVVKVQGRRNTSTQIRSPDAFVKGFRGVEVDDIVYSRMEMVQSWNMPAAEAWMKTKLPPHGKDHRTGGELENRERERERERLFFLCWQQIQLKPWEGWRPRSQKCTAKEMFNPRGDERAWCTWRVNVQSITG